MSQASVSFDTATHTNAAAQVPLTNTPSRMNRKQPHFNFAPRQCLLVTVLMLMLVSPTFGSITVNNITYESLPALFGRYMMDQKIYDARLQYLHSNPYLCELDDKTISQFVPPVGPTIHGHGGGNITLYDEPVALLVVRGNCPFQRKATVAESIHESVKFLLVANFNLDNTPEEEDSMVPMVSDFGDTELVLVSISHATGQAFKKYLSEQPGEVTSRGGPIIKLDSKRPEGMMTNQDLQSMLLSALGLFFMLMSFTGCLIILAGTYSQIVYLQDGGSGSGSDNPIAAVTQRRLLTQREVEQLTLATSEDIENSNAGAGASRPSSRMQTASFDGLDADDENDVVPLDEDQCAICLGEFDESSQTALPCRHRFHTSCIAPWLTERQSKCPLCKFDVLQYIREQELQQQQLDDSERGGSIANGSASTWDQLRRYRWTSVQPAESVERQVSSRPHDDDAGLELAEHHR